MKNRELQESLKELINEKFHFEPGEVVTIEVEAQQMEFALALKKEFIKMGAQDVVIRVSGKVVDSEHAEYKEVVLEVKNLKKHFVLKKTLMGKPISTLKAVDDISFKIRKGETLGIVGESGCGKTTMGRAILVVLLIVF